MPRPKCSRRVVLPKESADSRADRFEWERLCRRCGECCFEKWVEGDGTIHYTAIACQHLDIVTRECRVYDKRLEVGEGCVRLTPDLVATVRWLPSKCGYRQWLNHQR